MGRKILIIFVLLLGFFSVGAQTNTLTVPSVTARQGKTLSLPIYLDNTEDVVAVQFSISLPSGLSLESSSAILGTRAEGLDLTMRKISDGKYMAMIYSSSNQPIRGRTGTLLTVPMSVLSTLEEGSSHQMILSDVVIGIIDGKNVATGFEAGKVTIAKSADLEVSGVGTSASTLFPGDEMTVHWQVSNTGGLPTESGWSEQIYLKETDGTEKILTTVYYNGSLGVGGVVSRSAHIIIPEVMGLDGECYVKVRLNPNSDAGEPVWLLDNNTAVSASTVMVGKKLQLATSNKTLEERVGGITNLCLTRSGSVKDDEFFKVVSTNDSRVVMPSGITIPKGQSSAYITLELTPNGKLDDNAYVTIDISGCGYDNVSAEMDIEDDTYPCLTVESEKEEVTEGETIKFLIKAERPSDEDMKVNFSCDLSSRFNIPEIVLPAGQTSVEVLVEAKEDDSPDIVRFVTFTAKAAKYMPGTCVVDLVDNDLPILDLSFNRNAVSESDGPVSVVAKLRRTDNIDKRVIVKFTDDADGGIYYDHQTVELARGVEEITIALGPVDNSMADGERVYNISASVWIASCGCSPSGGASGGTVTVPLTIYDDDGPSLSIKTSSSTIREGGSTEITVSRNTDVSESIEVYTSSDYSDVLDYPSKIVIPANQRSETFTLHARKNETTDDAITAILTVESEGYSKANTWIMVTDQTLPDAQVTSIEVSADEVEAGGTVRVAATIENAGFHVLPELTKVGFYIDAQDAPLAIAYLQQPVLAGKSLEVNKEIRMPDSVGRYHLYVEVNDGQSIPELVYTNNKSLIKEVRTISPYRITLWTDKPVYNQCEPVVISGKAEGTNSSNHEIDIYLINGYRQTIRVRTDEVGSFSTVWTPSSQQGGHYILGACYPGEDLGTEMVSIDVLGINLETEFKGIEFATDEEYTGTLTIRNPGSIALNGVHCWLTNVPESCAVTLEKEGNIGVLEGNSTKYLSFTMKGVKASSGSAFERIQLTAAAEGGIESKGILYYYCYPHLGKIMADMTSIDCTVTKGTYRDVPVVLTNKGKGDTGNITLSIATPWIQNLTPLQMGSLRSGESTTIVFRLNPDNVQLNVAQTAKVGINCESGEGMLLNISMEPVSEEIGHLLVDVRDQFTYNTAEAPHLSGAEVSILHPVDNTVVVSGVTNDAGIFETDLPEGYYGLAVKAPSHESYSNNILINPGKTNVKNIDLSYTGGISITYTVEPVEGGVEDSYRIVTKVEYETNVPVPVMLLEGPTSIDAMSMRPGESVVLNYVATNKGLVTALDYHIVLPEACEDFSMIPLYDPTPRDIPANSSVAYPILFTRNPGYHDRKNMRSNSPGEDLVNNFNTCMTGLEQWYRNKCGTELRDNHGAVMLALKACAYGAIAGTIMDALSGLPSIGQPSGGGGGGGGGYSGGGDGTFVGVNPDRTICNPDVAEAANDGINLMLGAGLGPIAGAVNTGIDMGAETAVDGHPSFPTIAGAAIGALSPFTSDGFQMLSGAALNMGQAGAFFLNHGGVLNVKSRIGASTKQRNLPDWMVYFGEVANKMHEQMEAVLSIQDELFGNHYWIDHYDETMLPFVNELVKIAPSEISVERVSPYKPESISVEMMASFVERFYNIVNDVNSDNLPDYNKIIDAGIILQETESYARKKGYENMEEMYRTELAKYLSLYNEESNSVCSSVSLQFDQKMVMTREAFRGTLTVYNGHDSDPMEDIVLNLIVKDVNGVPVTEHEMTIAVESISNFGNSSSDSNWTLASKETGKATVLYIPTKYAAPEVAADYVFSGSLSYINPYNGMRVTEAFNPITLAVHPSPDLDLTYFMQRDILGDDPFTEAIEPSEEAEFSLLINNHGFGDATNVRVMTEQPRIIENDKGLLVDFELTGSQLNGAEKTLALGSGVTVDFGRIPGKSTSYAQWWFKSSLLGHFTNYDVEATHINSYDNPDLSLLDNVTIHELIRSVDVVESGEKIKGFLTNDIVDSEDTPDMLYLSNGEVESVSVSIATELAATSDTEYFVTVTPGGAGWNYGNVSDPTYGIAKLQRVVRQRDGAEISLRNFWQTDRTLRDGKDPLYENRIHFVDKFNSGADETYILTFEPMPKCLLEITSIGGIPAEGEVASVPVDKIEITFNKYIDANSFNGEDVSLYVQGNKQDSNLIGISTVDSKTFVLDLKELNKSTGNGYYVLEINTSGIVDEEGFNGRTGKSVGWNMYKDGCLLISTRVLPEKAGSIIGDRNVKYGKSVSFSAQSHEGYEFSHWTVDGVDVSEDVEWSAVAISDMDVVAYFVPKTFRVTVESSLLGGAIVGNATGIYEYGDEIVLNAVPDKDYEFEYWVVNGEKRSDEPSLTFHVNAESEVSASFKYIGLYHLQLELSAGWTWVSHNFTPALNLDNVVNDDRIVRVLSQTQELIRDPQLGIKGNLVELRPQECYKIESIAQLSSMLDGYFIWDASTPLPVNAGWNWLGYPLADPMPINDVLSSAEALDVIVGQYGFAQFDGDRWSGTLEMLVPGHGYMYQSQSSKDICYDMTGSTNVVQKICDRSLRSSALVLDIHKYPSVMPVIATLGGSDGTPLDNEDYQVAAFCGTECRGIGRTVDGLVMMNVYGNPDDRITFGVTDAEGEESYSTDASLRFSEDVVGDLFNPYVISINVGSGVAGVRYDGDVRVRVDRDMLLVRGIRAEDIDLLEVYSINGQKLIRETIVPESGVRVSSLEKGVYVVVVYGNGEYTYHRVVVN